MVTQGNGWHQLEYCGCSGAFKEVKQKIEPRKSVSERREAPEAGDEDVDRNRHGGEGSLLEKREEALEKGVEGIGSGGAESIGIELRVLAEFE
ncbi:hypothetical protein TorRG33x02_149380 [Trema orientale]|uniref:Uncharacterized protein n=1 Tax=Trema orientale TaxID=63057 RepID=A0A2P5EUS0_TREOI|nr:hypothetical protein TorRG33x02_149380 [Trema orientale]